MILSIGQVQSFAEASSSCAKCSVYMIEKSTRKIFGPGSTLIARHDEKTKYDFQLVVENKEGGYTLSVHVYNMGASWQVENISHASQEFLPPPSEEKGYTGVYRKKIKMSIPLSMRNADIRECNDVIKVFVTTPRTTFDMLELPKINGTIPWEPTGTGVVNTATEQYLNCSESGRWAAWNFHIRTVLD